MQACVVEARKASAMADVFLCYNKENNKNKLNWK